MTGTVFDIKDFSVHDGPGPRITVFLKGCPLRCRWCHNPEGLERHPQLFIKHKQCTHCGKCMAECTHIECITYKRCIHACPRGLISVVGKEMDASELTRKLIRDDDFLIGNGGGITFSGGEPLLQPDFLLEVIKLVRYNSSKMNFAIETCGYSPSEIYRRVIDQMDYIIMDIKMADPDEHKIYTGVANKSILENFEYLKISGKPFLIRIPLIPGITDTFKNISSILDIVGDSNIELIPYNEFAGLKYESVGKKFMLHEN